MSDKEELDKKVYEVYNEHDTLKLPSNEDPVHLFKVRAHELRIKRE